MTERKIPNRTADLNALPVGTVIKGAAYCGGDGIVTESALTHWRTGELEARLVVCAADVDNPCPEMVANDGCWPWWTSDADGDLDDEERWAEWTVALPDADREHDPR